MNAVRIALAVSAGAFTALALAMGGAAPYVSGMAALLGAAWVAVLVFRPKTPVHGLFLFLGLAGAGAAAVRGQIPLGLLACTAALFAWDSTAMQRFFSELPPRGRRAAEARYAIHAAATAIVALAIPGLALVVRPRLGFPAALGLAMAATLALAVALWQVGRVLRVRSAGDERDAAEDGVRELRDEGTEEGDAARR